MPAAALSAAATIGSSLIGAGATKKAAKGQEKAGERVAQMQLDMFQKGAGYLEPYRNFGAGSLPMLGGLLGYGSYPGASGSMGYPGVPQSGPDWNGYLQANPDVLKEYERIRREGVDFNSPWARENGVNQVLGPEEFAKWHYDTHGQKEGRMLPGAGTGTPGINGAISNAASNASMQAYLESIPGYQFARDQGMQAVTNKMAAKGLGGTSGAFGKGLARFVTGLADQTYGSQIERLLKAASMGQGAATDTAKLGADAAGGAGNSILAGAGARAGGIIGSGSQLQGGLYSLGSNTGLANGLGKFFGGMGGGGSGIVEGEWNGASPGLNIPGSTNWGV